MPFAKCSSHRARDRLFRALNRKPQGFYSFTRNDFHGIYEIAELERDIARSVKGVTILRGDTSDLLRCWSD